MAATKCKQAWQMFKTIQLNFKPSIEMKESDLPDEYTAKLNVILPHKQQNSELFENECDNDNA